MSNDKPTGDIFIADALEELAIAANNLEKATGIESDADAYLLISSALARTAGAIIKGRKSRHR